MATKKIIIDFQQQPVAGTAFKYTIYVGGVLLSYGGGLNKIDLSYRVGGNSNPYQIGIGVDLSDTIDRTLAFLIGQYHFAGSVGGYSTSISYARVGNTIEVSIISAATDQQITVWEIISTPDYILLRPEDPCVTGYISNQTVQGYAEINALPSNFYYIKNNTLNTSLGTFIPNSFNTRFDRGYNYSILLGSDMSIKANFDFPASISIANLNMYFSGNDLFVNIFGASPLLSFRYSLDNITFQDSSIFPSLSVGSYTVYIQDNFGCVKNFPITNSGTINTNVTTPYTYISESNSLRFINRVDHQNCGNYKNQFNTLSCEENLQIPNKYIQLFQACDTIKTQVKTSYDNLEIWIKDSLGAFTEITASKIVSNIGIEDKRDCTYYEVAGQLAIIYTTGNTYDYGTTNVNGTYQLNGLLPGYGIVGTWVETAYGTLQVANIYLDSNGNRSLIFNIFVSIPTPIAGTVQTIYNAESYDIWEFDIDMSVFLDLMFTIGIRFYQTTPDVNFPDVFWISEKVHVKTRHENSIEIIWSNSKNTDIYFYSGIQMKNRLNLAFVNTNLSDGEVETQRTDSQVIAIDATNYNAIEFEALALTTGMVRKIKLALKHDNLIIENVPYELAENPDTERQGQSNFYRLRAKLLEAGDVWNQGTSNTQTIYTNVPLIGLLSGDADAEYIKL